MYFHLKSDDAIRKCSTYMDIYLHVVTFCEIIFGENCGALLSL